MKIKTFLQAPLQDQLNLLDTLIQKAKGYVYYRHVFGSFGTNSVLRRPMLLSHPRFMHVGDNVSIRDGARLEVIRTRGGIEPRLMIGNNVLIEQNTQIICRSQVTIGSNVAIAGHCAIVDVTHPISTLDPSVNPGTRILEEDAPIWIGNGAFIGFGCIILPGVSIGECAVVGANSVVTRDVPPYTVVAGSPALILRKDRRIGANVVLPDSSAVAPS